MKKEVIRKAIKEEYIKRISYKSLRCMDASGYAHAFLLGTADTTNLVRHELHNLLLFDYPEDIYELRIEGEFIQIFCNGYLLYEGYENDIEFFYQQSSYAFKKLLKNQLKKLHQQL